ncbi:MAG: matrixin family metalloprotease [Planctomycetota bacterium]
MSNRSWWFGFSVIVAIGAGVGLTRPPPNVPKAQPDISYVEVPWTDDLGDELPKVPGHSLDWYVQHHDKTIKPSAPLEVCFAPGTPEDVVQYIEQNLYESNARYNLNTRWTGVQGEPQALTWSFVPDGTIILASGIVPAEVTSPSNLFATLDAQFAAVGGRATWINRIQLCFDRWQALTGLTYARVTVGGTDWDDGAAFSGTPGAPGLRGDCRISMHSLDGSNGVLAYNFFPQNGDMVLDSSENWTQNAIRLHLFLRNIISHEHGHGMGLSHVCPASSTKLMEPFLSTSYDGPRHDDIRAAQRHYGDTSGNNVTAASARVLGLCEVGAPIAVGALPPTPALTSPTNSSTLGIDANGEQDYYKFTLAGARQVTVVVTPKGQQYASYVQDANCNNVTFNVDSLAISDLSVDLLDTDGVTVLTTAAANGAGIAETISNFPIAGGGDFFLKIYEANAPTETQLYTVDISVQNPCTPVTIDPIAAASTVCGSAYNSAVPTFTGTPPINWSLSGIPPVGVTINPGTGQVSWPSPTTSPTPHLIQVTATNACGNDTEILSLTVLVGDFNGDGVLNDLDLPQFVDHLLGLDVSRVCAADVNGDLAVDGLDLLAWVDLAQ